MPSAIICFANLLEKILFSKLILSNVISINLFIFFILLRINLGFILFENIKTVDFSSRVNF